ncbi:Ig-like domain-containing protein, partial [Methylobacterium sp. Leaf89]|uniref:Ig-like domain-containing protein n=1 Tax=Methylobacterium sp. Leaf89 TaxID=1736245 RepID=UPI00138F64C7
PTLALSSGTLAKDGTLTATFRGDAPAGAIVKIYDGAQLVGQAVSGADGAYALKIPGVTAGSNVFTATATDAAGHLSKVSTEVVVEVGTAADILGRIDAIAAKTDLAGVYLTDKHVFTVSSVAQMQSMNALDKEVLAKIDGGYQFQFWSGTADNRTMTRYDADGTLVNSYTALTKDGVLVRETFVDATEAASYAREVYQYGITGKSYTTIYQAYDKAGNVVLTTRSHADGTLDYWSKVDASGTLTKVYDAAGKLKSTNLAGSDGVTVASNYNAAGDLANKTTTYADKSTDTQIFTNGVLTNEFVTHAAGSLVMKETFTYNIVGQSYVALHQSYSAANQLLTEFKTRADGSYDTITWLATDGSTRTRIYDVAQRLTSEKIVLADKSTDVKTYVAGVQTREVITRADGTKEAWDFGISGKAYGSIHRWYDASGKQTKLEYVAEKWVDTKFAPVLGLGTEPAPTLAMVQGRGAHAGIGPVMGPAPTAETQMVGGALVAVLKGEALAGSAVMIYDNGQPIGTTTAAANGSYSFKTAGLSAGPHVLSAATLTEAGLLSKNSDTVAAYVMTSAEFVKQIGAIGATAGLAGVWLTDGNVLTVPAGRVAQYVERYGAALKAIKGDGYSFAVKSGTPDNQTVSSYDSAGTLQDVVTRSYKDGRLVKETVVHNEADAAYAREVHQYGFTGKSYVETYQGYDTAGNLVLSTRSHADGSLDYQAVREADGTTTMRFFDAKGVLASTTVAGTDGSSKTVTVDAAGHVTSVNEVHADKSAVATVYDGAAVKSTTVTHAPGEAIGKEVFESGIKGLAYTATHTSYDAAGKVVAIERTDADGHLVSTLKTGADGTTTTESYIGGVLDEQIVKYAAGASIAKMVFDFTPQDATHASLGTAFDAAGRTLYTDALHRDGSHDVTVLARGVTVGSSPSDDHFTSAGADTFVFKGGFGHDTISGFNAGTSSLHDVLQFDAGAFLHDNPIWSARDVGNDVVLTTISHDTVTLLGVHKDQLVLNDFLIA